MPATVCHQCGAPVVLDEPIGRSLTCEACGKDLRSCLNCRHHDVRYHNACTESQADHVEDKARGNFCEFFYFSREPFTPKASGKKSAEARAKLEGMFGGPSGPQPKPEAKLERMLREHQSGDRAQQAREKLDALFRKPASKPPEGDAG